MSNCIVYITENTTFQFSTYLYYFEVLIILRLYNCIVHISQVHLPYDIQNTLSHRRCPGPKSLIIFPQLLLWCSLSLRFSRFLVFVNLFVFWFVFWTEDRTQDRMLARQALKHWDKSSTTRFSSFILGVSVASGHPSIFWPVVNFCDGLC